MVNIDETTCAVTMLPCTMPPRQPSQPFEGKFRDGCPFGNGCPKKKEVAPRFCRPHVFESQIERKLRILERMSDKKWPLESARYISLEAKFDATPASQPSRSRSLQTNIGDSRGIRRPRGPAVQPDRASILQANRSMGDDSPFKVRRQKTGDTDSTFGEQSSQDLDTQPGRPERKPPGQKEIQPISRQANTPTIKHIQAPAWQGANQSPPQSHRRRQQVRELTISKQAAMLHFNIGFYTCAGRYLVWNSVKQKKQCQQFKQRKT